VPKPVTLAKLAALASQLPPQEWKQLAETTLRDLYATPAVETPTACVA
jgi:hypothetical protein